MEFVQQLIEMSSPALSSPPSPRLTDVAAADPRLSTPPGRELMEMLGQKNGFFAFEQALEIYPVDATAYPNLVDWNAANGWRREYEGMRDDLVFFGQDAFGVQFYVSESEVGTFDPETGDTRALATALDGWAWLILDDYNVMTGHSLAHEWQVQHGALPAGTRLVPKVPFVAGGQFTVDNLYLCDCAESMRFRASIANQIRNLPDGATIELRIVE